MTSVLITVLTAATVALTLLLLAALSVIGQKQHEIESLEIDCRARVQANTELSRSCDYYRERKAQLMREVAALRRQLRGTALVDELPAHVPHEPGDWGLN